MVGTYVDGVVTCKYNLAHSALFTEKYKMIYGMGAMSGSTMQRHSKTPSRTTEEFTMVTGTTDGKKNSATGKHLSLAITSSLILAWLM